MISFIISKKCITRCTFLRGARVAPKVLLSKAQIKHCASEFLVFSALKLPSRGLVVFIDMYTFIFTELRKFKTFLKENYAVASGSCYARYFLKKRKRLVIEHDVDSAYRF